MPFGLCNAGAIFQRIMELMLKCVKSSTAYIDDVLTYSKTFEDHIQHLEELLIRLKDANIKVKTSKCKIACKETMFLGYKISDKGVTIDESSIKSLLKYPRPKTPKQVKQFLGLAGYYRQFIHNFAEIVDPINKLTRKKVKFIWDEKCERAFNTIIDLLSKSPILAYSDFSKRFYLATDASKIGIGAVLSQMDENGVERAIYYAIRSLYGAEQN